ncbi:hypothetical protein M0Q28_03345 [Patescibacteria group bacterium]|jgi:hypothetical protein|nr:hypothetical protein [Patescibacteria group bacterium]
MGRIRSAWGLFAFSAMFVAFLVLTITNHFGAKPPVETKSGDIPMESRVAAEVASKYAVPPGVPVVTRVSDAAILASVNPFYKDVRDGDWLLRYDGLLIAYRQEEGRILMIEQATSTR